jgi:hypothetical protein
LVVPITNILEDSNPSIASLLEMSVSPNVLKRPMRSMVIVLVVLFVVNVSYWDNTYELLVQKV